MPPAGFEPTISAGERPQTHVLDRAATGTGFTVQYLLNYPGFTVLAAYIVEGTTQRNVQ